MSAVGVPVTGVSELVLAAYVHDPDGNVVELWTWDVAGHLPHPS